MITLIVKSKNKTTLYTFKRKGVKYLYYRLVNIIKGNEVEIIIN